MSVEAGRQPDQLARRCVEAERLGGVLHRLWVDAQAEASLPEPRAEVQPDILIGQREDPEAAGGQYDVWRLAGGNEFRQPLPSLGRVGDAQEVDLDLAPPPGRIGRGELLLHRQLRRSVARAEADHDLDCPLRLPDGPARGWSDGRDARRRRWRGRTGGDRAAHREEPQQRAAAESRSLLPSPWSVPRARSRRSGTRPVPLPWAGLAGCRAAWPNSTTTSRCVPIVADRARPRKARAARRLIQLHHVRDGATGGIDGRTEAAGRRRATGARARWAATPVRPRRRASAAELDRVARSARGRDARRPGGRGRGDLGAALGAAHGRPRGADRAAARRPRPHPDAGLRVARQLRRRGGTPTT